MRFLTILIFISFIALGLGNQTAWGQEHPFDLLEVSDSLEHLVNKKSDQSLVYAETYILQARASNWHEAEVNLLKFVLNIHRKQGEFQLIQDSAAYAINIIDREAENYPLEKEEALYRLKAEYLKIKAQGGFRLGNYENAMKDLRQALALQETLTLEPEKVQTQRLAIFNEKAIIHYLQGELDSAITYFQEMVVLQKAIDSTAYNYVVYLSNLGALHQDLGQLSEALQVKLEAYSIAKAQEFSSEGQVLGTIAQLYFLLKDYELALTYAKKAMLYNQRGGQTFEVAFFASDVGDNFKKLGQLDSARHYYLYSLQLFSDLEDDDNKAYVLERIATLFLSQGNYDEALSYIDQGKAAIGDKDLPEEELRLLTAEADCYLAMNAPRQATRNLKRIEFLAETLENPKLQRDAFGLIHTLYDAQGNANAAYQTLKRYTALNDSVYVEEKVLEFSRIQYEYELEEETRRLETQRQQEAALYEKELERKRLLQRSTLGGGILVLIILLVVIYAYRINQKKNEELAYKNGELAQRNEEISAMREKERELAEETIALKERELTTHTMTSHEKNMLLTKLYDQLSVIVKKAEGGVALEIKEVVSNLRGNINQDSLDLFQAQFEKVHPRFFLQLNDEYPGLSVRDQRLCAYIRVGMDNPEIASLTNVTPGGVKKAISRLKKRMGLEAADDIRSTLFRIN